MTKGELKTLLEEEIAKADKMFEKCFSFLTARSFWEGYRLAKQETLKKLEEP
jgi:hypothetical protein